MYEEARKHFKKHDPILFAASQDIRLDEVVPSQDLFRDIVWTITGQQLSSMAANTIFSRFEDLFPDGPFDPRGILELEEARMREAGLSGAKIRAIRTFSEAVMQKKLDLTTLPHLGDADVMSLLTTLKGIGPWTAQMVLMFSLGRPDVFSPGDLGLKHGMQQLYKFRKPPSDERILEIAARWSPYRSYASRLLWKIADVENSRVPRRRPKVW